MRASYGAIYRKGGVALIHRGTFGLRPLTDAYWLHPRQRCYRDLETSSNSRYVLSTTPNPRASHKRCRACRDGSPKATRRRGSDGIQPSMHGNEGCRKDKRYHNHELRVGLHRKERKD